jgi:hypothetical protein
LVSTRNGRLRAAVNNKTPTLTEAGSALEIASCLIAMRDMKFPSEKNLKQIPTGLNTGLNLNMIHRIFVLWNIRLPLKGLRHFLGNF